MNWPAFWRGFWSAFDLTQPPPTEPLSAEDRLARAWETTGRHLRVACVTPPEQKPRRG